MRRYDTREAKKTYKSCRLPASPQLPPIKTSKLSKPIEFLNYISPAQAIALQQKILSRFLCHPHIDFKHIDEDISPAEIKTLISVTAQDGK
jgi:hypothetical protein